MENQTTNPFYPRPRLKLHIHICCLGSHQNHFCSDLGTELWIFETRKIGCKTSWIRGVIRCNKSKSEVSDILRIAKQNRTFAWPKGCITWRLVPMQLSHGWPGMAKRPRKTESAAMFSELEPLVLVWWTPVLNFHFCRTPRLASVRVIFWQEHAVA